MDGRTDGRTRSTHNAFMFYKERKGISESKCKVKVAPVL
jgi:hypothetical protein